MCLIKFPLHKAMLEVLQDGLSRQEFKSDALESVTSKDIYASRASDVEVKFPGVNFLELVYPRLNSKILEAEPRDTLFCMIHNLHPTRERLHQQRRAQDPFCPIPQCQGKLQNREHLFSSCYLVSWAWLWLHTKLLQLLLTTVGAVAISSVEFLLLTFPKDTMDKELVWMIGNFCDIVLKVSIAKKRRLSAVHVSSVMISCLQSQKNRAVVQPLIHHL